MISCFPFSYKNGYACNAASQQTTGQGCEIRQDGLVFYKLFNIKKLNSTLKIERPTANITLLIYQI